MRSSETLPAEGIGYIPVTRGYSGAFATKNSTNARTACDRDAAPLYLGWFTRCSQSAAYYSSALAIGKVLVTAPSAIEYILVTRWRGGKKGGQNRVCKCDTRVGS